MSEYYENTKVSKKFNAKMSSDFATECYSVIDVADRSAKTSRKTRFSWHGMSFDTYRA